jgi:TonB-dependent starch-binding outer membrane protein SusC
MRKILFLLLIMTVFSVSVASGQKDNKKFQVTGIVTDAGKRPVTGALILIDGKNTNIVTDGTGTYKIKVRPDADSISIITFTNGMATAAINRQDTINFMLGAKDTSQPEFKDNQGNNNVNIGYGNVTQKDLLNNVNTIDATNSKYASYKTIYDILKGTPGVMVTGNSVKIQGQSSINSGTEPLYVIDGMAVESIDGISPSMVESISVLKGSSTAIYGSRGANGVILVTLIKGK